MDNSKDYIKMCEMAEEIQHDKLNVGDFVYDGRVGETRIYGLNYKQVIVEDYAIWLPRQDQLQEMIEKKWKDGFNDITGRKFYPCDLLRAFCDFSVYCKPKESMEQLWLAFVMKEKYNKVWNGEDWV